MNRRLILLFAALLVTFVAGAEPRSVMTASGTFYSVETGGDENVVTLTRRGAETKESIVVPASRDEYRDADARLMYDAAGDRLFVIWRRDTEYDEVVLTSLNGKGEWSDLVVVDVDIAKHGELRTALTRAKVDDRQATLLHLVWWSKPHDELVARYALVAFEGNEHVSTQIGDLRDYAGRYRSASGSDRPEDTGEALYPPLAISAAGHEVDIVYGREQTTALTRVRIEARPVPHARIWRPLGARASDVPPAGIVSLSTAPVQASILNGRVVLYTIDKELRFVVLDNNQWSSTRRTAVDEKLDREELVRELHRLVEELPVVPPAPVGEPVIE